MAQAKLFTFVYCTAFGIFDSNLFSARTDPPTIHRGAALQLAPEADFLSYQKHSGKIFYCKLNLDLTGEMPYVAVMVTVGSGKVDVTKYQGFCVISVVAFFEVYFLSDA